MAYRCTECGRTWDDQFARDNEFRCVSTCGGELVAAESANEASQPTSLTGLDSLPSILAIPLSEYAAETHTVMRLHRLCDAAEILTRFCTIVLLGELRVRSGEDSLPPELLETLQPEIERPTFGRWKRMLSAVVDVLDRDAPLVVPELPAFVSEHLLPKLPGGETTPPEICLLSLRNRLVHGGAMTRAEAKYLLYGEQDDSQSESAAEESFTGWHAWLEDLPSQLAFFASCTVCFYHDQQARPVLGADQLAKAVPLPADLQVALRGLDEHVLMLRDGRWIDLWPLCGYGRAKAASLRGERRAKADSPLVYIRADRRRLLYAALGVDLPLGEQTEVVEQFRALFQLEDRLASADEIATDDFVEEVRRDADLRIGREQELSKAVALLKPAQTGVFWLYGPGGIGKSFITAAIAQAETFIGDPKKVFRIVWRFKASDQRRCRREAFFAYAIQRLAHWLQQPLPEVTSDPEQLRQELTGLLDQVANLKASSAYEHARAPRVLFILDGLDEIARSDPGFAQLPFQLQRENVVWLCAGRDEKNLGQVFAESRCQHVFPGGVPKMQKNDVRAMLTDGGGGLKYQMIALDNEPLDAASGDDVMNQAVEAVLERADGLPLYVHFVLEDLRSEHFRFDQLAERLPPSLSDYYDDLLKRLSIGDLHALLTPLVVTIAWAEAPLDEEALFWLLVQRQVITDSPSGRSVLHKGLRAVTSMLRESPTTDGLGFEPYHPTFREHIRGGGAVNEDGSRMLDQQSALARENFCKLATDWSELPLDHSVRDYALRFGPQHLTADGRWDEVETLLTDLFFLEAKNEAGLVFELAGDFSAGVSAFPEERPQRRILKLLEEALRRDIHFIHRHREDYPQGLFQCMWNTCWWYDCEKAPDHYVDGKPPSDDPSRPLSRLLIDWRGNKEPSAPGFTWLRCHRPPPLPLGSGQLARLEGHQSSVTSVTFSPDGARIASGSKDKAVRVWDAASGAQLARLEGHEGDVLSVAFSLDGARIASGSWDQTVRIWDAASGAEQARLDGHQDRVNSVAFSPDGARIASGSYDNTVRVWDAVSGVELARLEGHDNSVTSVAFSFDGARIVSGSYDQTVRAWDVASGAELARLEGQQSGVLSVAFSPDGARIASGSRDQTVRVWDAASGAQLARLEGHEGPVTSVAFSPKRARIVSGSEDKTMRVWDAASGTQLARLEGHQGDVLSVAFSPDGARIACGSFDKTVRIWDAASGAEQAHLDGHQDHVSSVAFSHDGARIASGSWDKIVWIWDAASGEQLTRLEGHKSAVFSMAFSHDGERIVSGSEDKTMRVWDAASGAQLARLEGHEGWVTSVAFSPNGARIASGSWDDTVRVWDAASGAELMRLEGHKGYVHSVAFSPDGARIASGSWDQTVRIWDAANGAQLAQLDGHEGDVFSVTFSPDGARIASKSDDNVVRVWDTASFECLGVIEGTGDVNAIAAGPAFFPFRAIERGFGTIIQNAATSEAVASFPEHLWIITTHPSGLIWAGSVANHLYIITLEGEPEANTQTNA